MSDPANSVCGVERRWYKRGGLDRNVDVFVAASFAVDVVYSAVLFSDRAGPGRIGPGRV